MNYAEELKGTRNFVLSHDSVSSELKITKLGKRITLHTKDDKVLRMYMQWTTKGCGYNE